MTNSRSSSGRKDNQKGVFFNLPHKILSVAVNAVYESNSTRAHVLQYSIRYARYPFVHWIVILPGQFIAFVISNYKTLNPSHRRTAAPRNQCPTPSTSGGIGDPPIFRRSRCLNASNTSERRNSMKTMNNLGCARGSCPWAAAVKNFREYTWSGEKIDMMCSFFFLNNVRCHDFISLF